MGAIFASVPVSCTPVAKHMRIAARSGLAWTATIFACVVGPALSGLVIAQLGCPLVYGIDAICGLACLGFVLPIHAPQEIAETHPHPLRDLSTGLLQRHVARTALDQLHAEAVLQLA